MPGGRSAHITRAIASAATATLAAVDHAASGQRCRRTAQAARATLSASDAVVNAANRGVLSARKQAELLHEFRPS